MKKIKVCVLGMLFAMAVLTLTACGNRNNAANDTTSAAGTQTTTQAATQGVTTERSTEMNNGTGESSTGVIGGIVDDVERGVDDVIDGTERTTNAADETTR